MKTGRAEEPISSPSELYHHLVKVMFTSFKRDHSDRFGTVSFIRSMAGFLFYALDKLSVKNEKTWFNSRELAGRFMDAVPPVREKYEEEIRNGTGSFTTEDYFRLGINNRFVDSFAVPFGLAESLTDSNYEVEIKQTDFLTVVFGK